MTYIYYKQKNCDDKYNYKIARFNIYKIINLLLKKNSKYINKLIYIKKNIFIEIYSICNI